jgi:uncharacterized membrane protein YdcZ (DUF606 family)
VGAAQVYPALRLVQRVCTGVDRFGWLRVPVHPINPGKIIGARLTIAAVVLISGR